jgi:hypothetical protein
MQPEDLLPPESRILLRERIDIFAAGAQARFHDAVIPIYGAKENGSPDHIGSAVLLKVNGRKVMLTAAHIVDENKVTTLYAPGRLKLIAIEGLFEATQAPHGNRDRDRFDFAYCGLSDELSQAIVGRFIDEHEVATSAVVEAGRLYTALGYPNSKNARRNPLTRSVRPTLFPYSNVHKVDEAVAASLPGGGQRHIFLPYGKRSRSNGQIGNSVQPRGMSGGAVIDAGRPADLAALISGVAPVPLLAGITIERPENRVLIATRMSTIMPFLQSAFPAA